MNFQFDLQLIAIRVPAIIIALTFHEFFHGFTAYLLGDKTAKKDGRLSFNPFRHIDLVGILCLMILGFGWAKPVMVDPNYFKNPKRGMAVTALAGPLSNFFLAFIVIMVYYPVYFTFATEGTAMGYLTLFLWVLFSINIVLGVFNLLPIPPLDGSKVFSVFLPEGAYFRFISFRYGFVVLLVLIYTGVTSNIMEPFITRMYQGYFIVVDLIYAFVLNFI